jgi:hypothetical protein
MPATKPRTPADVRSSAGEVTGLSLKGVVTAIPEAPDGYLIAHQGQSLVCDLSGPGASILLMTDIGGDTLYEWDTSSAGAPPEDNLEFLKMLCELTERPVFRRFERDGILDIVRRTYDSSHGPIRMSTRRLGAAQTEMILEHNGEIIRLVQDRATGGINLDAAEKLDSVPF